MPASQITAPQAPGGAGGAPPISVLWLIRGLNAGGAERLLTLGVRHRDRRDLAGRVAYLSPSADMLVAEIEAADVEATCLDAPTLWDPRWLWRLRRRLAGGQVDVLHAHSPTVAIGARMVLRTLRRQHRPRMVTTEHNMWNSHHRFTQWADAATFRGDDAHIAVSEAVRSSLPPALSESVEVILHGLDLGAVCRQADRDGARRSLGLADDELVIGTVANLRPSKAYPNLLEAARSVLDAFPRARFVAVGQGPLQDQIAALHTELGLGDRFLLLGYRADAVRIMSAFDIFCLASNYEGLPVAMMEALALGVPVVATDVGGVGEIVTSGREGILVPPGRSDLLARALVELASDPPRRATLAAGAAARGAALSVDDAVRRTEAVYRRLAGR